MPTRDITEPHIDPTDREATRLTNPVYGVATIVGSIVTSVLVIVQLIAAFLAMVVFMPSFTAIFEDFDTELPLLTRWLISIPPWLTGTATIVLILLVIGKEFVIRDRRITLTINLVLLFVSFFWIPLIVFGLFLPLVTLMESVM
ncbi:MAG: hypothetical protein WDZ31_07615 [Phycisphaeraceae bacterium]